MIVLFICVHILIIIVSAGYNASTPDMIQHRGVEEDYGVGKYREITWKEKIKHQGKNNE